MSIYQSGADCALHRVDLIPLALLAEARVVICSLCQHPDIMIIPGCLIACPTYHLLIADRFE